MTIPAALTHDAVLDKALEEFDGNQAELARSLEVAQSSISRWRAQLSKPEVGSALILARVTGLPRPDVLQAFGHDPSKLGLLDAHSTSPDDYTSQLRELGRMLRRFADQVDAMSGRRKRSASQPPYSAEGIPSQKQDKRHYDYQTPDRRVQQIPFIGDRRQAWAAS